MDARSGVPASLRLAQAGVRDSAPTDSGQTPRGNEPSGGCETDAHDTVSGGAFGERAANACHEQSQTIRRRPWLQDSSPVTAGCCKGSYTAEIERADSEARLMECAGRRDPDRGMQSGLALV